MKYILSFLALLFSYTLSAQVISVTVTKDLDTSILTKVPKNKVIRVGFLSYKDSTIFGDTIIQTVKKYAPPTTPNLPPSAQPGSPQTVTLPTSVVTLSGGGSSDPDGVISSYNWSKVSSLTGTITAPSSSKTDYVNFSAGVHTLRLTVIDNKGASNFKDVTITVFKNPTPDPTPGTTINFSFNQIPYSDPDIISPGRGAEQWHNSSARIPNPTESQPIGTENSLDVYYRFEAWRLQNADGSFNWSYFDNLVESAINKGQKLSFGIMTYNDDGGGGTSYGGGESAYSQWLHNKMQAESTKDVLLGGEWLPNWNSPTYIQWLRDIHTAIRGRLLSETHTPSSGPNAGKSVLYGDAIYVIDVRGYGNWGEWHCGGINANWNNQPNRPTASTLMAIIDAHTQIFDRWPLGMMIAGYDGGASGVPLFHPFPQVAHYALTAKNAWGDVGARRDQVGAPDGYLKAMLENNSLTYNGSPKFSTLFLEKWKKAPITGEPNPGVAPITGMADLAGQVSLYHHTSFGNGNYPFGSSLNLSTRNTIREGFKRAGYRLVLTGGKAVTSTGQIAITLNWQNVGNAPTYEVWEVLYELVSTNGTVITLGSSTFKPKWFLPMPTPTIVTDTYNVNISGTYTLRLTVRDLTGYRQPLPIAIQGRQSNGSYILANNVPLQSGQ